MSIRRRGAEPVVAAPRLTAVLAARQREVEATRGLPPLSKTGFLTDFRKAANERRGAKAAQAFRNAVKEPDGAKAARTVADAVKNLQPEQVQSLATEYAQTESDAWRAMETAVEQKDAHKARNARVVALETVLGAQLGLFALRAHAPDGVKPPPPPNRPTMPEIYNSNLWPSFNIKKGSTPWPNYRKLHDCWQRAIELSASTKDRR
jgi:hypothetical protein